MNISSPKIIKDLISSSYYSNPAISYSKLSRMLQTNEMDSLKPFKGNDAMRYGKAFHHYFLNALINRPVDVKSFTLNKRTKIGKSAAAQLDESDEEYFINNELSEASLMLQYFLKSHVQHESEKQVIDMFRDGGLVELSILWQNEKGDDFKSRLDCVKLDYETRTAYVLDLKTDGNLKTDLNKLYWHYKSMNYDLQMYCYTRALVSCGFVKVIYYTLSIERETGSYILSKYADLDFGEESFHRCEAFNEGEKKYILALEKYKTIQRKLKNNEPLSASLFQKCVDLNHPSFEN